MELLAGRYRVLRVIGEGGLGRVLEVEARDGRRYAAKVLKARFRDDAESVRRMLREAQAAASLRHPGIVGVRAIAHDAEHGPVLVMERLVGESLASLCARRRLDAVQARRVALAILDALGAAHRQGIVHRDVKPGNIHVERGSERIRLLDFGIAGVAARPALTLPGRFVGTHEFASPEQLDGRAATPRSDLYSLGVTLVFAMTARRPPARDVLAGRSPRPFLARLDLSPWWRAVLERALDPDPDARFQGAEEMADAVRSLPREPRRPLDPLDEADLVRPAEPDTILAG